MTDASSSQAGMPASVRFDGRILFLSDDPQIVRRQLDGENVTLAEADSPVFERAGVELIEPGCGACVNAGPGVSERADQVTVSAINRNFPGRSGPGQVWLASPSTVAASAIAGRIVSFEQLRWLAELAPQ